MDARRPFSFQNIYYYTKADRRSQFPKRLPPQLSTACRNESGHKRCGGIWQSARRNAGRLAEEVLPPRHSSAGSICPFSPKPKRRRGRAAAVVPYAAPAPSTAPRLPLPRRRTAASGAETARSVVHSRLSASAAAVRRRGQRRFCRFSLTEKNFFFFLPDY